MRIRDLILPLILVAPACATEAPFGFVSIDSDKNIGAVNQDFRAITDGVRKIDLTNGGTITGSLALSGTSNSLTFPDGTAQTTAYVSGTTITVGGSVYTTTCTYAAVLHGGWSIVASTNPSGSSLLYFTGLNPDFPHRITYRLRQGAADGIMRWRANADSGANYKWATSRNSDGAGTGNSGSTGDTSASLQHIATTSGNGQVGEILFGTDPSDKTILKSVGHMDTRTTNGEEQYSAGGFYDGAANISSLSLLESAGTFTGYVYVEALVPPTGP